ncbi:hypothetical protein HDU93_003609 [Gonapodya sp. JEL0774]|nr:hypothetical protein HDU93_003609 [Gonapodya sp. JEL0774]
MSSLPPNPDAAKDGGIIPAGKSNTVMGTQESSTLAMTGPCAHFDKILKTITNIAIRSQGDLDFFYLPGMDSGILLPAVKHFPTSWTAVVWVKLEAFTESEITGFLEEQWQEEVFEEVFSPDVPTTKSPSPFRKVSLLNYQPRVLSFLSSSLSGVEVFFDQDGSLHVTVMSGITLLFLKKLKYVHGTAPLKFTCLWMVCSNSASEETLN